MSRKRSWIGSPRPLSGLCANGTQPDKRWLVVRVTPTGSSPHTSKSPGRAVVGLGEYMTLESTLAIPRVGPSPTIAVAWRSGRATDQLADDHSSPKLKRGATTVGG
jgi:hypothetical protein